MVTFELSDSELQQLAYYRTWQKGDVGEMAPHIREHIQVLLIKEYLMTFHKIKKEEKKSA
jgi:hypothetical protein